MKKILFSLLMAWSLLGIANDETYQLTSKNIALLGKVYAPEGVTATPNGTIYTTSLTTGKIYSAKAPLFIPKVALDLSRLKGWKKDSKVLGIVAESEKDIWVALTNVHGGCVYHIKREARRIVANPAICGIGDANGLLVDKNRGLLYISTKKRGFTTAGMILAVKLSELKQTTRKGMPPTYRPDKHLLARMDMPNMMALSPNGKFLLFAQTMKDRVSVLNLATKEQRVIFESRENGWLDGLIYLKKYKLFATSDSKLGKIHFFSLSGRRVKTVELLGFDGKTAGPASLELIGDDLYFTDLWHGSLYASIMDEIVGGYLEYHQLVFRVPLSSLFDK